MAAAGPLRTMSPWMARPQGLRHNWRGRTKKSCSLLSPDPPITPPCGSLGAVPANGGGLSLGGVASAFCAARPTPPARVGPVLPGPLSPFPVPCAGCAARRAQSCEARPLEVLYVGPLLSGPLLPRPIFFVGRTGTVGIPPPLSAPPCSSWQWQAQSSQACPLDALRVGPVLSGPLLPRPVFCAGRTGTVGIPPPLSVPPCSSWQWQAQSCQARPRDALQVGPVLSGPLLPRPVSALGAPVQWGSPPPCLPSRAVFGISRPSLVAPAPLWRCEWVQSCQAESFIAPSLALGAHSLSCPPLCGCQPLNCDRVQSCQARHPLPHAQCRRAGTRGGNGLPPLCPGLAPEPAPLTGPLYGGLTFRFRGAPAGPPACWLPATAPPTRAIGGWQGTPPPPLLSTSVAIRARCALALQRARTGAASAVRRRAPPSGAAADGCFGRHCAAAPLPHSLCMGG